MNKKIILALLFCFFLANMLFVSAGLFGDIGRGLKDAIGVGSDCRADSECIGKCMGYKPAVPDSMKGPCYDSDGNVISYTCFKGDGKPEKMGKCGAKNPLGGGFEPGYVGIGGQGGGGGIGITGRWSF